MARKQRVKILVGPQEKMDLYTEDEEHAKLVPVNGSSRAVSDFMRGYVYFKFVPDQTGLWKFSFKRDWWLNAAIYDESGKIFADFRDDMTTSLEPNSMTSELQAGKTYFIRCRGCEYEDAVPENMDITIYSKYINREIHEHTWNSGIITKQPTCVTPGVKTYTCSGCQKTRTEEIPATGAHQYGAYTVTQQPTVLAAGIQVRTCGVCGKTESASIPKLTGTMALKASTLAILI